MGLVFLTSGYSTVQAQSADQVYQRLKSTYHTINAVRAEFTQTMSSSYSDESATSSGVVVMQGNKYRVETQAQTLVTDGNVTWVYLPGDGQVLINDYIEDETTFSMNDFLLNQADQYRATKVTTTLLGGQKHYVLTLTPKSQDSFFTEVLLSMRDRDNLVTRLQVKDVNGTTMVFDLKNIQLNPKLDGNVFTFQPPKNVEIVDMRS